MTTCTRRLAVKCLALAPAAALSLVGSPARGETSASERRRIERLLQAVESDTAVTFDRNGTRVGGRDAARFLRAKWSRQVQEVHTAEDFIAKIASRSSTSGRAYRVCMQPAHCSDAGPWLAALLRQLDGQAP